MYSTNTNNQQDRGRQAPNVKPAPKGGQTMKDMFTATPAEREIIERIAKRAVPFTVNTAIPTSMRWISRWTWKHVIATGAHCGLLTWSRLMLLT